MNSEDEILGQQESKASETEDRHQPEESLASASVLEETGPEQEKPAAEEPAAQQPAAEPAADQMTDEQMFLAALDGDMMLGGEYDNLLAPLSRGQIIKGTITSKSDSEILVDVGTKSEGIVAGRELEALDNETFRSLEVGQEVYVYVLVPENREGHPQLSLRRAMEEQDWIDADEYMGSGKVYRTKVIGYNKGGLIAPFGKVRGFVPASQVSQERRRRSGGSTPDQRWAEMVGDEMAVKVIEVDRRRNRLILSELAAEQEVRAERRATLLESLAAGQVLTGHVISLADFGAFVDIGGVDGLVHVSELDWKPVAHPRDVLRVGDEVEVEVISVDRERQRIGLSRRRRLPDPWVEMASRFQPDQLVQGIVTKMTKFGAFARLVEQPEIEGLIHISELAEHRVKHPREVVQEGEVLTLRILRIDPESRRLGLSLRQVSSEQYMNEDWQAVLEHVDDEPATPALEEASIEETPAAEAEVEEVPAAEVEVEEVPAAEVEVEEAPAAEAEVEEVPAAEVEVEEVPAAEAEVEEAPAAEVEAEEAPAAEVEVEEASTPEEDTGEKAQSGRKRSRSSV